MRSDNHFVVTAVEHRCANNLGSDAAEVLGSTDIEDGTYKNHFHAAPGAATVLPRWHHYAGVVKHQVQHRFIELRSWVD